MNNRFETRDVMLAGVACILMACCGCNVQGTPEPSPEPFPSPDPINTNGPDPINTNGEEEFPTNAELLIGSWKHESGAALNEHREDFYLTYVEFNDDGLATVFYENFSTQAKECNSAIYVHTDENELILSSASDSPKVLTFAIIDEDTLELTDGELQTSTFVREENVPDEFRCHQLIEEVRHELPFKIDSSAEVANDGVSLWVTGRQNGYSHYPIDPATGVVGDPVEFGFARQTKFMQDGDNWSTCGCGGNTDLDRYAANSTTTTDTFRTDTIGERLFIRAAAQNPVDKIILLHGRDSSLDRYKFATVNAEVEPDEMLDNAEFDLFLSSLAFDGELVWAMRGRNLMLIDPVEYVVVATYRLPDPTVRWYGVTVLGTDIWIVGINGDGETSTLMQVSTGQLTADIPLNGGALDPIVNP
ncbi:MAG: hypothetical protein DHS20C16_22290 [Phycisphaerae bacterium]|nr:MAG: hypothetical protein DHS20C16_22290 [Phycisphaerae bacterium]